MKEYLLQCEIKGLAGEFRWAPKARLFLFVGLHCIHQKF